MFQRKGTERAGPDALGSHVTWAWMHPGAEVSSLTSVNVPQILRLSHDSDSGSLDSGLS